MGYAATSAMSTIDGDTIRNAGRFSERPLERRGAAEVACGTVVVASAIGRLLEGRQRLVDRALHLLHRVGGSLAAGESIVDVVVDRLRDLRVHRRHGAGLRLRDGLLELVGERQRLLDLRVVVRRAEHRRERELARVADVVLLAGDVVHDGQRGARVLRVDRDDRVVPAENAGLAAALEGRLRADLEVALDLRALVVVARGVGVRPVTHERVLAGLPCGQRLGLHVGRHGLRGRALLDAVDHELQRADRLRRVDRGLRAVPVEDLAAGGEQELEEVTRQALVRGALVDDAALLGGLLVDGLPGLRDRLDLLGVVVEEPGVSRLGDAEVLVLEVDRLERRADELGLAALDDGRHVVDPLLRRELRRPDHVGREDVAVAGLRLLTLDELLALRVGRGRELEQLHGDAGVLGVVRLHPGVGVAGRVLALAVRDRALGAVRGVRVDDLRAGGRLPPAAGSGPAATATAATAAVASAAARGDDKRAQRDGYCRAQTKATSHATPPPGTYIARAVTGFRNVTGRTGTARGNLASRPNTCQGRLIDSGLGSGCGGGAATASDDPGRGAPRGRQRGHGLARPQRHPGRAQRDAGAGSRRDRRAGIPPELDRPQPVAGPLAGDRRGRPVLHDAVGRRAAARRLPARRPSRLRADALRRRDAGAARRRVPRLRAARPRRRPARHLAAAARRRGRRARARRPAGRHDRHRPPARAARRHRRRPRRRARRRAPDRARPPADRVRRRPARQPVRLHVERAPSARLPPRAAAGGPAAGAGPPGGRAPPPPPGARPPPPRAAARRPPPRAPPPPPHPRRPRAPRRAGAP